MHTINIFATTNMFEPPASNLNFKTLALGPPQSVQSLGFVGLLWRGAWRFFPILVVMDSYGSWPLFAKSSFHLGSTWVNHFNRVTWMYACMSTCAAPSLQSALPGHPILPGTAVHHRWSPGCLYTSVMGNRPRPPPGISGPREPRPKGTKAPTRHQPNWGCGTRSLQALRIFSVRPVARSQPLRRWTDGWTNFKYLMDEPKNTPRWAKCLTWLDFDFAIWDIRAVIPTESGLRIWTTLFVSKAHVQVSARLQCPRRSFYQVPPGIIKRNNRKPPHILCRFIAGKFGGVSIDTFDHWRVCSFYNMHHEQCQCFHSEGSGMNTWPTVSPVRSVALFQS